MTMKLLIMTLILFASSCDASKNVSENTETNTEEAITIESKKMLEAGFIKGEILVQKNEAGCPFTIKLEDGRMMDPINLEDNYKITNTKIWLKFAGLRMMNRCDIAQPISIIEIQKRAE